MAIYNSHDAFFKKCLTNLELAKDFLAIHLPQGIKEKCDFSTLQVEPSSFVDKVLRQYHSDILYSVRVGGLRSYIFILVEHQSNPDKLMPFRLLHYQVLLMKKHLENHNQLPLIVPLVFYQGTRSPYPYSLELFDCFEDKILAQNFMFKPAHLIDLSIIPDDEIKAHKNIALLEMVQKHIFTRDIVHFMQNVLDILHYQVPPKEVLEDVVQYIFVNKEQEDYHLIVDLLQRDSQKIGGEVMATIAEYLIGQGVEKGIEKGIEKGKKESIKKVIKNMVREGLGIDSVQRFTGLSNAEFEKILKEIKF